MQSGCCEIKRLAMGALAAQRRRGVVSERLRACWRVGRRAELVLLSAPYGRASKCRRARISPLAANMFRYCSILVDVFFAAIFLGLLFSPRSYSENPTLFVGKVVLIVCVTLLLRRIDRFFERRARNRDSIRSAYGRSSLCFCCIGKLASG